MKTTKEQIKPDWFGGFVGTKHQTRTNPYSGESYELNPLELAIYDFTIGANEIATSMDAKYLKTLKEEDRNPDAEKFWDFVRKGNSWFREHNAKAYMVLLD